MPEFLIWLPKVSPWYQPHQEDTWIDWRFTTEDAPLQLHRLDPSIKT